MTTYKTSLGERVSKAEIDRKVKAAKKIKLEIQLEEHGYNFCEETGQSSGTYFDCAHIISVDECQKSGRAELAWSLDNIKILARKVHQKKDGLNLQFRWNESK